MVAATTSIGLTGTGAVQITSHALLTAGFTGPLTVLEKLGLQQKTVGQENFADAMQKSAGTAVNSKNIVGEVSKDIVTKLLPNWQAVPSPAPFATAESSIAIGQKSLTGERAVSQLVPGESGEQAVDQSISWRVSTSPLLPNPNSSSPKMAISLQSVGRVSNPQVEKSLKAAPFFETVAQEKTVAEAPALQGLALNLPPATNIFPIEKTDQAITQPEPSAVQMLPSQMLHIGQTSKMENVSPALGATKQAETSPGKTKKQPESEIQSAGTGTSDASNFAPIGPDNLPVPSAGISANPASLVPSTPTLEPKSLPNMIHSLKSKMPSVAAPATATSEQLQQHVAASTPEGPSEIQTTNKTTIEDLKQPGEPLAGIASMPGIPASVASANHEVTSTLLAVRPLDVTGEVELASQPHKLLPGDLSLVSMQSAKPNQLEVGVRGGELGWIKVRAELGSNGEVNAFLRGASPTVAQMLQTQLPKIEAFLGTQAIAIQSVHIERPLLHGSSNTTGSLAEAGSGSTSAGDQQANPGAGRGNVVASETFRGNAGVDAEADDHDVSVSIPEQVLLSASETGNWLSVRA